MRLQINVQRHELPQVRFLFNTTSRHTPGIQRLTTISDLLSAVHAFVPLESSDGEWALEDYTVEVAARAGQEIAYECFHFQELKDVFREDDEVVIRSLSNEELRERRRGGRLQITSDGRHLFDGMSWGRRWHHAQVRPGIEIPPRKRRRLLVEQENDNTELALPPDQELVLFSNEDDDEYKEDEEDEDNDVSDSDEVLAIKDHANRSSLSESVDDDLLKEIGVGDVQPGTDPLEAQASSEHEDSVPEDLSGVEDDATELQDLIDDAPEVVGLLTSRKRKRPSSTRINVVSPKSVTFEGFLSSPKSFHVNGQDNIQDMAQSAKPLIMSDASNGELGHEEVDDSDDNSSSNGSGSQSESSTSSSDESDDTSDSSSNSSEESSEDSDSGESTSSSESSQKSIESAAEVGSEQPLKSSKTAHLQISDFPIMAAIADTMVTKPNVPPGSGSNKTKRHNERIRKKKLLTKLKSTGELSKDANFDTLKVYLQTKSNDETVTEWIAKDDQVPEADRAIAARKAEILSRLNAVTAVNISDGQTKFAPRLRSVPTSHPQSSSQPLIRDTDMTSGPQKDFTSDSLRPFTQPATVTKVFQDNSLISEDAPLISISDKAVELSTTTGADLDKASPKRSRLDLGSSRRMLFNALGVRTPKTPADEQALREKLSKQIRQPKAKEVSLDDNKQSTTPSVDFWKSKLVVMAVECDSDRRQIEVPPFPFKHPWQVRKDKEKRSTMPSTIDDVSSQGQNVTVDSDEQLTVVPHADVPASDLMVISQSAISSGDAHDHIVVPLDFEVLLPLDAIHLVDGNVIAFRELHINSSFEPELSPYRTARIISNDDGQLRLQLASQDWQQHTQQYDETGRRTFGKFEMPTEEDDELDDGVRTMTFQDMTNPRLVKEARSDTVIPDSLPQLVTNSNRIHSSIDVGTTQGEPGFELQATHADVQVSNLSSPRRAIIDDMIKEAGFNSPLDKQLLEPLPNPAALRTDSTLKEEISTPRHEKMPSQNQDESIEEDEWLSTTEPVTSPARPMKDPSYMPTSSPPSESIVTSVRYPHLSYLESDTSPPAAESGSHQDAQRLTPTPFLEIGQTTILSDISLGRNQHYTRNRIQGSSNVQHISTKQGTSNEHISSPLPSEIPQTQSAAADVTASDIVQMKEEVNKHLSEGSDRGPEDSIHDHDSDYHSDDSLPSISELTSSQRLRSKGKQNPSVKSGLNAIQEQGSQSDPPRRSPRTRKPLARYKPLADSEASNSSQPAMKFSQSQQDHVTMSQIPPQAAEVIDLTMTSNVSRSASESDAEAEAEKESEGGGPNHVMETRTRGRKAGVRAHDGNNSNNSQQAVAIRRTFDGLGEKSYLKRRKQTS